MQSPCIAAHPVPGGGRRGDLLEFAPDHAIPTGFAPGRVHGIGQPSVSPSQPRPGPAQGTPWQGSPTANAAHASPNASRPTCSTSTRAPSYPCSSRVVSVKRSASCGVESPLQPPRRLQTSSCSVRTPERPVIDLAYVRVRFRAWAAACCQLSSSRQRMREARFLREVRRA